MVDLSAEALPAVVHWGTDLGDVADAELADLVRASTPPVAPNTVDPPVRLELIPTHARGWAGLPGISGHREGRDWSPLFRGADWDVTVVDHGGAIAVSAADEVACLSLTVKMRLEASGLLRAQAVLRNDGPEPYQVDGVVLALPVPTEATVLLDMTGRWSRERVPRRGPFRPGAHVRDSRRGRTGHDASMLLAAGHAGFGFRSGEVWAVHVAWSGNHRTYAERLPSGAGVLGGGELLLPGEVRLGPGESYTTPWLMASYGHGLDEVSHRFHRWLRGRCEHPRSPRPVVLNTWEAVYFEHDLATLMRLADLAAEIGVERFVLDDGWFRGRRDDRTGLGDWEVDPEVWPHGLHPLVDHVLRLGMDFGLWVEPEMVNPDSDLARAHPEWIMATGGRLPPASRHQQVLDLGHDGAWAHVLGKLDMLLTDYRIAYLKWDHNRDLVDAGHQPEGVAGVHRQTVAVYRLIDELRRRHPGVEIESCSSGGGRVDLEIAQRAERVWASDCNDALERQQIQRWTGLLLPPEMIGAHVGPPVSHTTGRQHCLAFRAATAMFGHFGIEWNIAEADPHERDELAEWLAAYKRLRSLLHSGSVVRGDHPDPELWVHGVVDIDGAEAVFAIVAVGTQMTTSPGRVRLPGLDPATTYEVRPLPPGDRPRMWAPAPWMDCGTLVLAGSVLGVVGVETPALWPDQVLLLEARAR